MDILIFILALMGIGFILYGVGAAVGSILKKEMSTEEFINLLEEEKRKRKEETERYYEQLHQKGKVR